jgi:hypothetical protein
VRTRAKEPVRPRARGVVTTFEVHKDLRRQYKVAAAELEVTMRELVEEALRAFLPELEKRRAAARKAR